MVYITVHAADFQHIKTHLNEGHKRLVVFVFFLFYSHIYSIALDKS